MNMTATIPERKTETVMTVCLKAELFDFADIVL
jgi:hypothetical protein